MALRLRSPDILVTIAAVLVAGLAACSQAEERRDQLGEQSGGKLSVQPPLALFTTLPIYWSEAADVADLLSSQGPPHWARVEIEQDRVLTPVDVLTRDTLQQFDNLLMAQTRALSPSENVALDDWVRGGGRLLLFADPLLTSHSPYAIGDKRRPQDVALLSPILARWGLQLQFDQGQSAGEYLANFEGVALPVDLPGAFALGATAKDAPSDCRLLAGGLAATCAIGEGHALILADAALLDREIDDQAVRGKALSRLMAEAYGPQ
jgi:hypothetical protein